jgi:hypothetical protein
MKEHRVTLTGLPKISLNQWYAGTHWTKRTEIKKIYAKLVSLQCKCLFSSKKRYNVEWTFFFKSNPLDSSNCVAMAKMIEDIIFENDKFDIVLSSKYSSRKDKDERVEIKVFELD